MNELMNGLIYILTQPIPIIVILLNISILWYVIHKFKTGTLKYWHLIAPVIVLVLSAEYFRVVISFLYLWNVL